MSFSSRPGGGTAFPSSHVHPLAGRTVLQIVPELEAGGAERTTVDIAEGLVHAGARALVATEGGRLVGELQTKGGIWIPFPAATKNPFSMLLNVRKLARICYNERVSLVHARSRAPAWVGLGASRSLNIPFVTTYHGSYSGRSSVKVLYNSVMARGDAVIANSEYTGELIRSVYPQSGERIRVIHRGTDFAVFSPGAVAPERIEALRKAWDVAPHERVVLLAARLTGWKGQKVLIEAAAKLRDAGLADVAYILAGDPAGAGFLREGSRQPDRGEEAQGNRAPGRPLHRHAGGLPGGLRRHRAFDRARGLRPFGGGGPGHGNAGRRLRSRRSAGDRSLPAGRAAARADGLAHPGRATPMRSPRRSAQH